MPHTPGPWKAFQCTDGSWIIDGNINWVGCIAALSYDLDCDRDELDSNARLIAAAPELLAAAEEACRWWENQERIDAAPWIYTLSAAIRRARGEE